MAFMTKTPILRKSFNCCAFKILMSGYHSKGFLSSLLPSLGKLGSNAKERCQGAGFSVLFCLASSGLGSPAWPPTLLGSGSRKKGAGAGAGVGAMAVGAAVGTQAGRGCHLRLPAERRLDRCALSAHPPPPPAGGHGGR